VGVGVLIDPPSIVLAVYETLALAREPNEG
jgi:hypothetical protein